MYTQGQLGLSGMKFGDKRPVNLFEGGVNQNSLVWGKIDMVYMGNNQFQIVKDYFDFDIVWSDGFTARNIGTAVGGWVCYSGLFLPLPLLYGGPFDIYVNGYITIKK